MVQDLELHFAHLLSSDSVVDDLKDGPELRRVDLLVLAGDVQSCDSEALEVGFSEVSPLRECFVDNANCYEKCLRPHFEFVMQLCQPVDQVLSILVGDLHLYASVQEVGRIHVIQLLLFHVDQYFRDKFDDRLWVANLEHVIQIQVGFVLSQPVFSSYIHFSDDFLQFFRVKLGTGGGWRCCCLS